MPVLDAELEIFRTTVNCAALLERATPGWMLDSRGSTKRALKYRRAKGEILIVNHEGRGWWDPKSQAKGDVFDLVRHLEPSMNFGQVRKALRRYVGIAPTFPANLPNGPTDVDLRPVTDRWARRPKLQPRSAAWHYLEVTRGIPAAILRDAAAQDVVREGAYGSAWFAHRHNNSVSHVDIRGPDFRGSLRDGRKTLFRFGEARRTVIRLAVTEAPIDALSLAAIENLRPDTLYVATGGGMGPGTVHAIETELVRMAPIPGARLVSGTDANDAGHGYAHRHEELALRANIKFERLCPRGGIDWNDVLKLRGTA